MNLLTTKQVAKILKVNTSRVCQLILAGRLPALKLGRDWIISKDDLGKVANRKIGRPKRKKQKDYPNLLVGRPKGKPLRTKKGTNHRK